MPKKHHLPGFAAALALLTLSLPARAGITVSGDYSPASPENFWTSGGSASTAGTIGSTGEGALTVTAATLDLGSATLGLTATGSGTVTVGSGGVWQNAGILTVGADGTGSLTVDGGGMVSNSDGFIGYNSNNNSLAVTGDGSQWSNNGNLYMGSYGSDNTITIEDGALVTVNGVIMFGYDPNSGGYENTTGNFLRLDGGYLALPGGTESVEDLINGERIQLWNGTAWVMSMDTADYSYAYFATNEAAEAFSGYGGLGGYTILTTVPEPETWTLIGFGGIAVLFIYRRKKGRSDGLAKGALKN